MTQHFSMEIDIIFHFHKFLVYTFQSYILTSPYISLLSIDYKPLFMCLPPWKKGQYPRDGSGNTVMEP